MLCNGSDLIPSIYLHLYSSNLAIHSAVFFTISSVNVLVKTAGTIAQYVPLWESKITIKLKSFQCST